MSKTITIPAIGANPLVIQINNDRYEYKVGQTYEVPDEVAVLIDNVLLNLPKEGREPRITIVKPVQKTSGMTSPVGIDEDGKLFSTNTIYTLPAASASAIGGVKLAVSVADVDASAELSALIASYNTLLAALRTSGVLTVPATT